MLVTFGVILGKMGMCGTASTHHLVISSTISGTSPHASPMPRSPIPCGQERFSSIMSHPDSAVIWASSCQSALLYPHMMEEMTTCSGCFSLSHLTPSTQYAADFSEMSSILVKPVMLVPTLCPVGMILGETFVMRSWSREYVLVTAKPHPYWKPRSIIS